MPTPVFFLHGASSSGKTVLARALQSIAPLPYWHLSIDHLRDSGVSPMARYRGGDFDWTADRARNFAAFHAMLGAVAQRGCPLIIEHILDTPGWLEDLYHRLIGCDVVFVAVRCDLAELNRRAAKRADRAKGSAEKDYLNIHKGLVYDLDVDGSGPAMRNAELILTAQASSTRRSSFCAP